MNEVIEIPEEKISNYERMRIEYRNRMKKKLADLRGVDFLRAFITELREGLKEVYDDAGYTLNLSPNDLKIIDKHNYPRICDNLKLKYDVVLAYVEEGAHLGEVIISNLGGEWEYPSLRRINTYFFFVKIGVPLGLIPPIVFHHCFVRHENRNIPVMEIAHRHLYKEKRYSSYFEIYERIRTTGDWK